MSKPRWGQTLGSLAGGYDSQAQEEPLADALLECESWTPEGLERRVPSPCQLTAPTPVVHTARVNVGRNDLCPCGSGKKYKKCCLSASRPPPGAYTREDRSSAATKLESYVLETLGQQDDEAFDELWGHWLETDHELPEAWEALSEYVCDLWFAYDRPLPDGQLVVDRFVAEHGRRLPPGELRYLQVLRESSMRVYEVQASRPGESLTLRDVLEGDVVTVQEKSGSRTLRRWEWLVARVVPGASGRLELEGLLPMPPVLNRHLGERLRAARDAFRAEHPGGGVLSFYKQLLPELHQLWLGCIFEPQLPSLANTDGEELVLTRTTFAVLDPQATRAALGRVKVLERGDGEHDRWHWQGTNPAGESISLGLLTLSAETLTLEANSVARAARGRALVEAAAGAAVRHRSTSHEDLQRSLRERLKEGGPAEAPEAEIPPEVQDALVLEHQARHYHAWLDEAVPALENQTPRDAAASKTLRPKLTELLHELDLMYQRALAEGAPAFDPSWLRDELGLEGEPPPHPPPLAHERVARLVPGSDEVARSVAQAQRSAPGFDAAVTVASASALRDDLQLRRFLKEAPDAPPANQPLFEHLELMVGFELHHRKAFWVDPALAYMLARTELDVRGEELRVPFPSFALVFTDRHVLSLAERQLSRTPGCPLAGHYLHVVTAFVTEQHDAGARTLALRFACDAFGADLPWILSLDLPLADGEGVEKFLDARCPPVVTEPAVPDANPLRGLVQVAVNATLYATSADVVPETREAPREKPSRRPKQGPQTWSSESVFFLPGAIEISQVRRLQQLERLGEGRAVLRRFMVRGHWRRPAAGWSDQRLRWVRPYWKGPDMAAVIERTYKLKQ